MNVILSECRLHLGFLPTLKSNAKKMFLQVRRKSRIVANDADGTDFKRVRELPSAVRIHGTFVVVVRLLHR